MTATAPATITYVDSIYVALPRRESAHRLFHGHATVKRRLAKGNRRRRGAVKVAGRRYPRFVCVHQPTAAALETIRRLVAERNAAVLRIDVARDRICASQDEADELHARTRRRVLLSWGGTDPIRVVRGATTYVGRPRQRGGNDPEGTTYAAYTDHRAADKHPGSPPTFHEELRFTGSRVVRSAVGPTLDIDRAWRRLREMEPPSAADVARAVGIDPDDMRRVGVVARALQNEASEAPWAQDVAAFLRARGVDPRRVSSSRKMGTRESEAPSARCARSSDSPRIPHTRVGLRSRPPVARARTRTTNPDQLQ